MLHVTTQTNQKLHKIYSTTARFIQHHLYSLVIHCTDIYLKFLYTRKEKSKKKISWDCEKKLSMCANLYWKIALKDFHQVNKQNYTEKIH